MHIKHIALFTIAAAATVLAGCANKQVADSKIPSECVFPDSPRDPAPLWVCDAPVEGVAVYAMGSHEKSTAGPAFMKDQATAVARVRLAQNMRTHVQNMIKQYAETTGAASAETVDRTNTSVSKLITSESIEGSRIFRSITSPTGAFYVLVGLDPMLAEQKTKDAIKTSMNSDRALWQQFKAKQGQTELAAEIAKMDGK